MLLQPTIDIHESQYIKRLAVNVSSMGDNTLVAAVTNRIIRVHDVMLIANGMVDVRFESGAGGTALTGQIPLVANTGFAPGWSPVGHFETVSGDLLNLELSDGVRVSGWLVYQEVEVGLYGAG